MSNVLAQFSSFHLYIYCHIDIVNILPTSAFLSGLVQRMFSSWGIRNAAVPQQSFPHTIPMIICKKGMPFPQTYLHLVCQEYLGAFIFIQSLIILSHHTACVFWPTYCLGVITHYDFSLIVLHERPFALGEAPQSHSQSTWREAILDQLKNPTSYQCCGRYSSTYGHKPDQFAH